MQYFTKKSALAFVLAALLVVIVSYFFHFNSQQNAYYTSIIDQLNKLSELDQRIDENLALSQANLLPNYDELNQYLLATDNLIHELSLPHYQWPVDIKNIVEEASNIKSTFNQKKEKVEFIKSDVAVVRNSTIYLPLLVFQSQREFVKYDIPSDLTEALEQIIRTLNLKDHQRDSEAREALYVNGEILNGIENDFVINRINLINKHLETIFLYQQQVLKNLDIINQIDFHTQLKKMSLRYTKHNQEQQHHLQKTALLLAIIVVGLIATIGATFFRLRKQREWLQTENIQRLKINKALAKLSEFNHHDASTSFYDLCVQNLAEASNSHIALISCYSDETKKELTTHSVWVKGEVGENFSYMIKDGPCGAALKHDEFCVEQDLVKRFPKSSVIGKLGMQSYFGKVFTDTQNNPIGLIALMNAKPTVTDDWLKSLLSVFATRISIEIERSKNVEALYKEKEQAITTLNSIADGVIATDEFGVVTRINQAAQQVLGLTEDIKGIGLKTSQLFTVQESASTKTTLDPVNSCLTTRKPIITKRQNILSTQTGCSLALQLSAAPVINATEKLIGAIVVLHDVSQERELQAKLSYQANHDSLTGLVNRQSLESELEQTLANFRPDEKHSLLYIDLDKFKIVNDTCGHNAGDELLRKFANLLQEHARGSDIVARLGGDEFFLLLHNCPLANSHSIALGILDQIEQFRFFWDDKEFSLSASIGLLELETNIHKSTDIMSMVDLACLQAKSEGRNRVVVSTLNDEAYSQRKGEVLWVPRLRNAIDNNTFELFQQAIIQKKQLPSSNVEHSTHIEILLRMREEDGSLVMPHEFISAAERHDMMAEIDRWVIKHVIALMVGKTSGANLMHTELVAINLSGQSLADPSLLDFIQQEISTNKITAGRLCFEITETNAIANQTNAIHLLTTLKAQGCQFALDDFGSGLSSYAYIKNLPADYLKIDRSFTKNLSTDNINCAIVKSVIDVARNIGMKSIAEGVEDEGTLQMLENLGVDYMQGYALDLPSPIKDINTSS
jgi:diguanylate cyclase (GGDEF)-like protein/PAS domain S-box-containing protein